jgi:hypothetical protein
MVGEDFGDGLAGGAFNLLVGIDEGKAKPFGKPSADRRLAGTHQANEHDDTLAELLPDRFGILAIDTTRHGSREMFSAFYPLRSKTKQ